MQLLILGMHRSGTSGVTRLLNLAGAWFGPEGIATEANEENPRGFWERRDVRAVCDGLLDGGSFDWWKVAGFSLEAIRPEVRREQLERFAAIVEELDGHQPWVVKEPRLCLLLPLLRPLLDRPVCVHVTREPLEVAQSVHRRDGLPLQGAIGLWELYTAHAFAASEGLPRVLVRHEDLLADPVATTRQLVGALSDLGVTGLHDVADEDVLSFISPDLHRQHQHSSLRRGRLNPDQVALAESIDDGTILGSSGPRILSAGGRDELVAVEQFVHLGELERRVADEARYREVEIARRHHLGRVADDALRDLADQLDRVDRSRVGRISRRIMSARRTIDPRVRSSSTGALDRPRAALAELRRDLSALTSQEPAPGSATSGTFATEQPLVRRTRRRRAEPDRPSIAVLAWDVGHNPLGRANVLAEVLARHFEVEMWGAQFERYGSQVWAPLQGAATPINVFPGHRFPQHLATVAEVAAHLDADALWVSKPRLPSYLLGIEAKRARNRPLVLDVDDHELAFFGADRGLSPAEVLARGARSLELPFEEAWTRAVDPYIGAADQITVSNVALQQRYGGLVVPHARDEQRFDPSRYDREAVRARLGVTARDRLLLFGGTPRAHKGVVEVLAALERLGDDRYRVLMFGTREFEEMRPGLGDLARWALVLPAQSFDDLPGLVVAADLACVIQDPVHPVSRYQMPAKLSDALAMAVPVLVTRTPPLGPLIEAGVVHVLEADDQLHERISRVFDDPQEALDRARRGRELFLRSFSYAAVADEVVPMFERLLGETPSLGAPLLELAALPARAFARTPGVRVPSVDPVRRPRRLDPGAPPFPPGADFDVAMFWRQNDSGLYGRRQDMVLEELARSPRVGTIVHFDNPISVEELARTRWAGRGQSDQRRLVVDETVARALHRRDAPGVHRHTYVYGGRYAGRLGRRGRNGYVAHVRSVLEGHDVGVGGRPLVVWAYPSNDDLPALVDALAPAVVVADVVDDNRTWYEPGSPQGSRIDRNYQQVLARSDVVIANCEPVAAAMRGHAPEVHVIPNGAELPDDEPAGPRHGALSGLTGPVIAYVGNLSARLDLDLLEGVALARPAWNLVLVGSAHLDRAALALDRLPNVQVVGVLPYREVRRFLRHVDVGLIPHVDNEMTRSMNPLKAFVYAAAGVPIVATPVANLLELGDLVTVARDVDGFVAAIESHLAAGRPVVDRARLAPHSWTDRVGRMLDLIDRAAEPAG